MLNRQLETLRALAKDLKVAGTFKLYKKVLKILNLKKKNVFSKCLLILVF